MSVSAAGKEKGDEDGGGSIYGWERRGQLEYDILSPRSYISTYVPCSVPMATTNHHRVVAD